jgi:gliding motility-associated-like protein
MNSRIFQRVTFLFILFITSVTGNAQLVAKFSGTPLSGCAPLIVRYSDESTGNPTSWRWDLGNGTISFLQNPSVLYFTPGRYTIKLIVKNATNTDSVVKLNYVDVYAKPAPVISVSSTTGCYPLDIQFTDSTPAASGTVSSWLWDFGDGTVSTSQNPTHTYTSARNFSVTLQVKNINGCITTLISPSLIQIHDGVLAQFTANNPHSCAAPIKINFQNQSTGTGVVNYLWNFGDNSTSTLLNPSHTYTSAGSYTVKLIVTNGNGCTNTIIKQNAVTVGTVKSGFTPSDTTVCQSTNIDFKSTSVPTPASVVWQFGDGTTSDLLTATKAYTTAGTYTVKMFADFGSCSDSTIKTITILPKPNSLFSATDTASCKAPLTPNFSNQSTDAISYLWNFGDNTTSTLPDPSHTYTKAGNYSVTLTATGPNGCTSSLTKSKYIKIVRPLATITNVPDSGCVPFLKTFNVTVNSADAVVSYLWDFGDGNTSDAADPSHTYTSDGSYNVSVIINTANGCTDTARQKRAIIASDKPTAKFVADITKTCAIMPVQFTDLSTGNPTRWLWDFGDKSASTLKNPSHLFVDTGYFDIKLITWRSGCGDSVIIPKYIRINPPIAKFTVKNNCDKPFEKVFTDRSIGADEWFWDFGDGNTSTLQNPVNTYLSTGLYTITLKVVNRQSGCDYTTTNQIRVINVIANFAASDTSICRGISDNFTTGLSVNDVKTFNWTFGDRSPSRNSPANSNSISYKYLTNGLFTVRLITTDANGCLDTLIKTNYIRVNGPTAKFTSSVPGTCLNKTVSFNDSTITDGTHPIMQWKWNYGDGKSETLNASPFQHTFTTEGSYTVKLQVVDSKGCTDSINIPTPLIISKPRAAFTSLDTFTCQGKAVRFVNQSTGPKLTYDWNFGDDSTSTIQTASHVYSQDGKYTVNLNITDQYGCSDSTKKTYYINIASPRSFFTMSDSAGNCPPLIVKFTNQSTNAKSKKWDFGDSTYSSDTDPTHFYNYPGTYVVTLTITSATGCTDSYNRSIVIKGPEGSFTYKPLNGCKPVNVNFAASTNGKSSFVWDFNDGNIHSGPDSNVSHAYIYPGKYVPKMILVDAAGCQVPIRGRDTIYVSHVNANFSFNSQSFCDSATVRFSDSSIAINDLVSTYKWDFGDSIVSTSRNPVHFYTKPGTYFPTLTASTRGGCLDTLISATAVKIAASPRPSIMASNNGCAPLAVTFSSGLLVADTSSIKWTWNFGNGDSSVTANPPVANYTIAGKYSVKLIATNSTGCSGSVSKNVEAYAIPAVSAGKDVMLCNGSSVKLSASGANTYNWSPAATLSCKSCAEPTSSTDISISYVVTGRSVQGCASMDTVAVTVKNKFVLKHSKNDSLCRGETKKLSASGATHYSWTPSNTLNDASISNPVATPEATTTYTVVATDDLGCFKDTGYVSLRVNSIPTVEAGVDKTVNVGRAIDLVPVISSDVIDVDWQPTNALTRNFYPGITVKPTENTEYTVAVKTKGGCMARDKVTVFVICNGSNIYIPNTFSPNNDGVNDIFYPRGTGLFKVKTLRIFSRWGEVIFEKSNFDANNAAYGWDGTNKGRNFNADVFVYTIDIICDNGSVLTYHGNVALIK